MIRSNVDHKLLARVWEEHKINLIMPLSDFYLLVCESQGTPGYIALIINRMVAYDPNMVEWFKNMNYKSVNRMVEIFVKHVREE